MMVLVLVVVVVVMLIMIMVTTTVRTGINARATNHPTTTSIME